MNPISSQSREYLYAFVGSATGREPVDVAFTQPGIEPVSGDWHPAGWADASDDGAEVRILIGPGALELAEGTWQLWVRVTRPDEVPVLSSGLVPIV